MPYKIWFVDNYSEEAREARLYLPGDPCRPNVCALDPDENESGDHLEEESPARGNHSGWVSCDNRQYTEWMHLRCIIEATEMGAGIGLMIGNAEITTSGKHMKAV